MAEISLETAKDFVTGFFNRRELKAARIREEQQQRQQQQKEKEGGAASFSTGANGKSSNAAAAASPTTIRVTLPNPQTSAGTLRQSSIALLACVRAVELEVKAIQQRAHEHIWTVHAAERSKTHHHHNNYNSSGSGNINMMMTNSLMLDDEQGSVFGGSFARLPKRTGSGRGTAAAADVWKGFERVASGIMAETTTMTAAGAATTSTAAVSASVTASRAGSPNPVFFDQSATATTTATAAAFDDTTTNAASKNSSNTGMTGNQPFPIQPLQRCSSVLTGSGPGSVLGSPLRSPKSAASMMIPTSTLTPLGGAVSGAAALSSNSALKQATGRHAAQALFHALAVAAAFDIDLSGLPGEPVSPTQGATAAAAESVYSVSVPSSTTNTTNRVATSVSAAAGADSTNSALSTGGTATPSSAAAIAAAGSSVAAAMMMMPANLSFPPAMWTSSGNAAEDESLTAHPIYGQMYTSTLSMPPLFDAASSVPTPSSHVQQRRGSLGTQYASGGSAIASAASSHTTYPSALTFSSVLTHAPAAGVRASACAVAVAPETRNAAAATAAAAANNTAAASTTIVPTTAPRINRLGALAASFRLQRESSTHSSSASSTQSNSSGLKSGTTTGTAARNSSSSTSVSTQAPAHRQQNHHHHNEHDPELQQQPTTGSNSAANSERNVFGSGRICSSNSIGLHSSGGLREKFLNHRAQRRQEKTRAMDQAAFFRSLGAVNPDHTHKLVRQHLSVIMQKRAMTLQHQQQQQVHMQPQQPRPRSLSAVYRLLTPEDAEAALSQHEMIEIHENTHDEEETVGGDRSETAPPSRRPSVFPPSRRESTLTLLAMSENDGAPRQPSLHHQHLLMRLASEATGDETDRLAANVGAVLAAAAAAAVAKSPRNNTSSNNNNNSEPQQKQNDNLRALFQRPLSSALASSARTASMSRSLFARMSAAPASGGAGRGGFLSQLGVSRNQEATAANGAGAAAAGGGSGFLAMLGASRGHHNNFNAEDLNSLHFQARSTSSHNSLVAPSSSSSGAQNLLVMRVPSSVQSNSNSSSASNPNNIIHNFAHTHSFPIMALTQSQRESQEDLADSSRHTHTGTPTADAHQLMLQSVTSHCGSERFLFGNEDVIVVNEEGEVVIGDHPGSGVGSFYGNPVASGSGNSPDLHHHQHHQQQQQLHHLQEHPGARRLSGSVYGGSMQRPPFYAVGLRNIPTATALSDIGDAVESCYGGDGGGSPSGDPSPASHTQARFPDSSPSSFHQHPVHHHHHYNYYGLPPQQQQQQQLHHHRRVSSPSMQGVYFVAPPAAAKRRKSSSSGAGGGADAAAASAAAEFAHPLSAHAAALAAVTAVANWSSAHGSRTASRSHSRHPSTGISPIQQISPDRPPMTNNNNNIPGALSVAPLPPPFAAASQQQRAQTQQLQQEQQRQANLERQQPQQPQQQYYQISASVNESPNDRNNRSGSLANTSSTDSVSAGNFTLPPSVCPPAAPHVISPESPMCTSVPALASSDALPPPGQGDRTAAHSDDDDDGANQASGRRAVTVQEQKQRRESLPNGASSQSFPAFEPVESGLSEE